MDAELAGLFEPYVWAWFTDTFREPSPPQVASWPRIAAGQNTLILSPTGSGKTLASFLWCLNELFRLGRDERLEDTVYVLYISPLKALNNDIQKNLVEPLQGILAAAERMGVSVPEVRSAVRTGDTTTKQRSAMVRRPPHVLITTPESLYIILATERFREALRSVRYVIVDEIHAMSDNKRGVHLSLSLERLEQWVRSEPADAGQDARAPGFVRIGLSATQNPLDEIARFLVGMGDDGQPRPCEIVDVGGRKDLDVQVVSPVDNLLEAQFDAIWGSAYDELLHLVEDHRTTLIFTNSRYKAERTALRLTELAEDGRIRVGAHHGSMSKRVRLAMENQLKRGALDVLVATSSLELGIDVGSIDLVCQIQSPKSVSSGMQRIGRSGHLLQATSKGRLLVTDRDDLVESTVLTRAILAGDIDRTRVPHNCLDVLAQQVVGAVAADPWEADALFACFRHAYCYHDLDRADYDRVLAMLAGEYQFDMEYPPYPKITWDRVNRMLYPEASARMIAFRASGTIPDVSEYDVYFEARKTVVGRLGESFVEELHPGDIFILGSTSWHVLRIVRNRVIVEDVYGKAPTIPFWFGDRASRTYELGLMVGAFRREVAALLDADGAPADGDGTRDGVEGRLAEHLAAHYPVDRAGARAMAAYFNEQRFVTGAMPSDRLVLIEHFRDELGQLQVVIHSPFGIRVHDPWAMVLCRAFVERYEAPPTSATTDDGILLTFSASLEESIGDDVPEVLRSLVTPETLEPLLRRAVLDAPVFKSRFRHNAVRAMMVLRQYKGPRTPVWLQGLRASGLYEAVASDDSFPLIVETLRECMNEALDVPNFRRVMAALFDGEIAVRVIQTQVPSPFTHSLLLLGQYGEPGSTPTRERQSRLIHLHRELLRQILDDETLRHLLDEGVVTDVDRRLQRTSGRRARTPNELARILQELGDLVMAYDEGLGLPDRVAGPREGAVAIAQAMVDSLVAEHRAVLVPIPTAETHPERWIATETFPLYRAAFRAGGHLDAADAALLAQLRRDGPLPLDGIAGDGDVARRIDRLLRTYDVLRLVQGWRPTYVAADAWIPDHVRDESWTREDARAALVRKFARWHGPFTKYEVMDRYGLPESWVETALDALTEEGVLARGEYVATKAFPQWCYRPNLETIHHLTLRRLRKEMEPAGPGVYVDFLLRWQHMAPGTQLEGLDGLRQVIEQLQGHENYQIVFERDLFNGRIRDYQTAMLDRLCQSGEVIWRRFGYKDYRVRRGQIGFCLRKDQGWVVTDPQEAGIDMRQYDEDIPEVCDAVRDYLIQHGASFFDDIVSGTGLDWRYALRAIWHLAWTGEATNDSYESVRYADVASGLSGSYDLATRPTKKGVTIDFIVRHILENRRLDPRLGRWAPTERLLPADREPVDPDERMARWVDLLLRRHGIVAKETLKLERDGPSWSAIRRALAKKELLGQVRRGYFVEGLSGEQYATPEAVEALRAAKLRQMAREDAEAPPDPADPADRSHVANLPDPEEGLVLANLYDPGNPFGQLFPITDEIGNKIKLMATPTKYLILQHGQPVLLYEDRVTLLADLPRETVEAALRLLTGIIDHPAPVESRTEICIREWNTHPISVSPARHLLATLGFVVVSNRWKGAVYDGVNRPDAAMVAEAEQELLDVYERVGKESSPIVYDADWVISQANETIRPKVRELIAWLQARLPETCRFVYRPRYFRDFQILYRDTRCINPMVQQKQIRLQITHTGWTPGILITPETDLGDPAFVDTFEAQFTHTCGEIDKLLDGDGKAQQ